MPKKAKKVNKDALLIFPSENPQYRYEIYYKHNGLFAGYLGRSSESRETTQSDIFSNALIPQ